MRNSVDIVNDKAEGSGDDLLELVHALMHGYRSLQYRILRDGPHAVTPMDAKVLGFFGTHPGATQRELALHSGRDKAQLARLVGGLCDKGLLARAADAADKRQVRLSLTEAGREVQRLLQRQARRLGAQATAGLSDAERGQLAALLRRVKSNFDAAAPAEGLGGAAIQPRDRVTARRN